MPQFTIKRLLALILAAAMCSVVVSFALRGRPWAVGVTAAVAALAVLLLVHGLVFFLTWLLAEVAAWYQLRRRPRGAAPGDAQPVGPPPS